MIISKIVSYICDNQPKTTLSDGTITPTCIVSDADGADPAIGSAPAPSPALGYCTGLFFGN